MLEIPRTTRRISLSTLIFLAGAAAYAIAFCGVIPFFIDEAFTRNLAADPDLKHMLSALRGGADGSFPAFGILVFGWGKVFGPSELSLRLLSAGATVAFAYHSYWHLKQRLQVLPVALGTTLAFTNTMVVFYLFQGRFYGLLLFATSLCFWSTWMMLETPQCPSRRRLVHGCFCALLSLSHPFGILYAACFGAIYLVFAVIRSRFRWQNAAAFAGGPLAFLAWLPSFLDQQKIKAVFPDENPAHHHLLQYAFLDSWSFGLLALVAITLGCLSARMSRREGSEDGLKHATGWLLAYSGTVILAINAAVFALDSTGTVQVYAGGAIRYLLPTLVAYIALFSTGFALIQYLAAQWGARQPRTWAIAVAIVFLGWPITRLGDQWSSWEQERSTREPRLIRIAELANDKGYPLVCDNHIDAFFLATQTTARTVKYVLQESFPYYTLMRATAFHYPKPEPITPEQCEQMAEDYVFVRFNREAAIVPAAKTASPGESR
jgi:hypothetical protein